MFSGIVETTTAVLSVGMQGKCRRVRIRKPSAWKLAIGESVSVDGICSTVTAKSGRYFDVEYMPQTLSKTTGGSFKKESVVNLERSLRYGDRIHGHFVAGHIDTTSRVMRVDRQGRSRAISMTIPPGISKHIVPRGSIAVNGVSLTVAKKSRGFLSVALIPHTLDATNLGALETGDIVNIECDMMARYRDGGTVSTHATKKARR